MGFNKLRIYFSIFGISICACFIREYECQLILDQTLFVLMSQEGHSDIATNNKNNLEASLKTFGSENPHVILLHKDLPIVGGWTIFPILKPLLKNYPEWIKWFVFLDEKGSVDPTILSELLNKHDIRNEVFIGRALQDQHPVSLHHYNTNLEMEYPDFSAGFVLSRSLIQRLSNMEWPKIANFPVQQERDPNWYYTIDAQYELALAIYNQTLNADHKDAINYGHQVPTTLVDEPRFCVEFEEGCATWITDNTSVATAKEIFTLGEKTLFAVKTCKKFHNERLPIVIQTWGKAALNIELFSEAKSKKYKTKVLPEVYQNTEDGHCQKTEEIFKYFKKNAEIKGWKWLVLVDDDTILGVHKLLEFINHYNPNDPMVIGRRYGYRFFQGDQGYNYITGGAGMVYSLAMVTEILRYNGRQCKCPKPDEHDDMYFAGVCAKKLGIPVLHSDRFHQMSPSDYSPDLLQNFNPISFHKFYIIDEEYGTRSWNDPRRTYNKYFKDSDEYLKMYKYKMKKFDDEL